MGQQFDLQIEAGQLSNRKFNDREKMSFLNKAQNELIKERFAKWKNRAGIGYGDHRVRDSELAGLATGTHKIPRTHMLLGSEGNGGLYGPDLDNADQAEDQFGVFVPIPNECMYVIAERAETIKGEVVKHNTEVKKITYDEYVSSIYNDHLKPYANLLWSLDWGSYTASESEVSGLFTNSTKEFSDTGAGYNMRGYNYLNAPHLPTHMPGDFMYINTDRAFYLIPGKGWKINGFTIRYIKLPADIHIDLQTPSLQRNCQLPDFMHNDVIDKAVKLASASQIPDPNAYQVNDIQDKEDQ